MWYPEENHFVINVFTIILFFNIVSQSSQLKSNTQGDRLDSKEQYCLASCQDRYLDIRKAVGDSLEKKQSAI